MELTKNNLIGLIQYVSGEFKEDLIDVTEQDAESILNEYLKAINYTRCSTQLPTFDESNLNKNEYADDVQKTIHNNLCKPSYKIGWQDCYNWVKQSLTK